MKKVECFTIGKDHNNTDNIPIFKLFFTNFKKNNG